MALIAGWFAQNRGTSDPSLHPRRAALIAALHHLPTYAGMTLRCREQCLEIAKSLVNTEHIFVLGKGFGEPIAFEGALKVCCFVFLSRCGVNEGNVAFLRRRVDAIATCGLREPDKNAVELSA